MGNDGLFSLVMVNCSFGFTSEIMVADGPKSMNVVKLGFNIVRVCAHSG